ncbi:hypothetical protein GOV12_05280 [Candidatus Pacearchaeota archaeon]|nr:hypothetical protein [Candidatus Pacearchaeota archaeon]
MVEKFVHFVLPLKKDIVIKSNLVNVPSYEETIYDALGFFEDEIFLKRNFICKHEIINDKILLDNIINLHDEQGLQIKKISRMIKTLKTGKHILSRNGLPNIKLVQSKNKEWILFDGHHTLLSYKLLNNELLNQVPHMIIQSDLGYFNDNHLRVFFGNHSKKLINKDWRKHVINWNEKVNNQLRIRKRNNIKELYNEIKNNL